MANLLLKIKYDGTNYHGWQIQKNALSVQEVLQNAIEKLYGERLDIKGCSRTDTGVHAKMYCVSYFTEKFSDEYHTVSALNSFLPNDVRVYSCVKVDDDFHARYSSKGKEYVYLVYNSRFADPFLDRYSFQYKFPIDEKKLNLASKAFIGTHDFASFCSVGSDVEDTVRTIYDFKVEKNGDLVKFTVSGDGFLYNMVRIMVGTLLAVEQGSILSDKIPLIIDAKNRKMAGKTAPAKGLFLNKVFYE